MGLGESAVVRAACLIGCVALIATGSCTGSSDASNTGGASGAAAHGAGGGAGTGGSAGSTDAGKDHSAAGAAGVGAAGTSGAGGSAGNATDGSAGAPDASAGSAGASTGGSAGSIDAGNDAPIDAPDDGYHPCGDTQSDPWNCGSCGRKCPVLQAGQCVNGVCQPAMVGCWGYTMLSDYYPCTVLCPQLGFACAANGCADNAGFGGATSETFWGSTTCGGTSTDFGYQDCNLPATRGKGTSTKCCCQ